MKITIKNKERGEFIVEDTKTIVQEVHRTVNVDKLKKRLEVLIEEELSLNKQLNRIKREKNDINEILAGVENELKKA